jgi:hypothetical protein
MRISGYGAFEGRLYPSPEGVSVRVENAATPDWVEVYLTLDELRTSVAVAEALQVEFAADMEADPYVQAADPFR